MSKTYKILSIADRTFPTNQAFLEEVLAQLLPERGHKVSWILQSGQPQDYFQKVEWFNSEVNVLPARNTKSFFGKVLNRVNRTMQMICHMNRLVKTDRPDVIQIRNDWIAGCWAIFKRGQWKIPIVFQYSRPGSDFILFQASEESGLYKVVLKIRGHLDKWFVHQVMKRVDHVLPISEAMKKRLIREGLNENKMTSFPMGFNINDIDKPYDFNIIRTTYGLNQTPVLLYFGAMGINRKLDFLLRVLKLVLQEIPIVKLLMVGGKSNDLPYLEKECKELGVTGNVIFIQRQPRQKLPEYILASDIIISPFYPNSMLWIASPTKMIESLAMGRPVVANDIPEQEIVLTESGGGICVPYKEADFAEAILYLLHNPLTARQMGLNGQKYIIRERSYQQMALNLEKIYDNLIRESL